MRLSQSLLFLALIVSGGCGKTVEQPATYDVRLPQELKEMFFFKPGSYWIYFEPGTGFYDSIWVVSSKIDTTPILHKGSRDTLGLKESFQVTFQSIFFGSRFQHFSQVDENCVWYGSGVCYWINRGNLNSSNKLVSTTRIFGYPFNKKSQHPISLGNTTDAVILLDTILPAFELDSNMVFNQAHKTLVTIDPTQQNTEVHRYFVSGIGPIRRHLPKGNIDWRLIRHRVVQ
jgi:hypothetical protein